MFKYHTLVGLSTRGPSDNTPNILNTSAGESNASYRAGFPSRSPLNAQSSNALTSDNIKNIPVHLLGSNNRTSYPHSNPPKFHKPTKNN